MNQADQLADAREEWIRQAIKQVVDERKQRNTKRCPQCHATLNKHTPPRCPQCGNETERHDHLKLKTIPED